MGGVARRGAGVVTGPCTTEPVGDPPAGQALPGDLLLEADDAVEQSLGSGRAPGHVDVDRHDLVEVWDALIGVVQEPAPPSTLMGVTVLGYPGQLVELEAVAAVAAEVTGQPPLA